MKWRTTGLNYWAEAPNDSNNSEFKDKATVLVVFLEMTFHAVFSQYSVFLVRLIWVGGGCISWVVNVEVATWTIQIISTTHFLVFCSHDLVHCLKHILYHFSFLVSSLGSLQNPTSTDQLYT